MSTKFRDARDPHTRPALGPTLEFLTLIWELNHVLEISSSRLKRTVGVTAQQRMILRIVGKFPGIAAGQLASLLHVHPGTLSTALARLERRGLVTRQRDAHDKRRVFLGLTAKGRTFDAPAAGSVESAVARVLRGSPEADVASTRRCLRALVDELERAADDASA